MDHTQACYRDYSGGKRQYCWMSSHVMSISLDDNEFRFHSPLYTQQQLPSKDWNSPTSWCSTDSNRQFEEKTSLILTWRWQEESKEFWSLADIQSKNERKSTNTLTISFHSKFPWQPTGLYIGYVTSWITLPQSNTLVQSIFAVLLVVPATMTESRLVFLAARAADSPVLP